ncbi:T9SS type A sorting domain-containing protein [Cellulophaga baltica]|uniref:T9SS type A sorting domain-containing protein n=1 Tax=Cellulophaga TaxID=104264 RepID=UPI001C0743AC|nr:MULTISPECIES: T9SS type A sorting domain-containing protein [Cellulophaga]MBU2996298.1 T9SS type A sorting domain-containing protein [Cellulophaga baltica]MDO6767693.1 T9SS type A sorting domain-containing protein [Cellulophaga sp. 1_MG-2023]
MSKKLLTILLLSIFYTSLAQDFTDSEQGLRADWMRGSLGLLWLPENNFNGNIEGISIEPFLTQIEHLRTIDYIQLPLTSPNIYSPVHVAPHSILESLWEEDRDADGFPINLIVPRESTDDPLLNWLIAVREAGLKTEIYVNSYNLLARIPENIPDAYPDISERWQDYCDTDTIVQEFINSQSYHSDDEHDRRAYMFCYAEFILKEYALRYGDLIDAWCFDSADNIMETECGDDPSSELVDDQRIYQAFADAVHEGNPNAAVSFNNSVGTANRPFTTPTLFDDYTFGHPFGGAGDMVETESLYTRNFGICEYMNEHNGLPFATTDTRDWNDNVVGHFFPKQSTTSWNSGAVGCLTDEEFVEWNTVGLINGGAITWGTPLIITNLENRYAQENLILQEYALNQLELLEENLKEFQYPGAPNWSRSYTILQDAYFGVPYSQTLVEGVDFWDPEGDEIININLIDQPDWLNIEETEPGIWTLSGTPTENSVVDYEFTIQASDASGSRERVVVLSVLGEETETILSSDVQIQAIADTNYGIDSIATMVSETQIAPDGLATYQISIELTPSTGNAIVSGESGGTSTSKSFAVGTTNNDNLFTGSNYEWINNINNIQIINFNANGGIYDIDDITVSFKSIVIVNAQSTNDSVSLGFEDLIITYGNTRSNTYELDLESLTGGIVVNSFSIGTGNTSETNKWSIDGITVNVDFTVNNTPSTNLDLIDNLEEISIHPIPTDSEIIIEGATNSIIQIYDMPGRLLLTKKLLTDSEEVDLSHLSSGTYFIQVYGNQEIIGAKILKE